MRDCLFVIVSGQVESRERRNTWLRERESSNEQTYKGPRRKMEDETKTREARQPEREKNRTPSRDGDCFVGDMIILNLSVFKEDVASALRS